MAWRFKASKYKNTVPVEPKLDKQIRELAIGSYTSSGNHIGASATHIAFNWDTLGSSLAVLPINTTGRPDKGTIPRIDGHTDTVNDFSFSPFDDSLLVTGSTDQTVKLWKLPRGGLYTSLTKPEATIPEHPRRVETVGFSPAVHGLVATSAGTGLYLWDFAGSGSDSAKELFSWDGHADRLQCVAWQWEGRLLATQARDKHLRLFDPRAGDNKGGLVGETASHDGIKDSKVVWVGENRLLTSGFGADRARELILRDTRNLSAPQHKLSLDVSSGILVPLFDPDTNMVFLAGIGDRAIQFVEVTDRDPWFVEGLRYTGEQVKGACLIPKRSVDVMQCEVNRVLLLGNNSIVPIMWQVPRKSYRDYQTDIFPDTRGPYSAIGSQDWWEGSNAVPATISLNPAKRPEDNYVVYGPAVADIPASGGAPPPASTPNNDLNHNNAANSRLATPRTSVVGNDNRASCDNGETDNNRRSSSARKISESSSVGSARRASSTNNATETGSAQMTPSSSPKPSPKPRNPSVSGGGGAAGLADELNGSSLGAAVTPVPAPRPASSTSAAGDAGDMPPPTMPVPRVSRTSSSGSGPANRQSFDMTDDAATGNGVFKRTPSIRDRMKMFERAASLDTGNGRESVGSTTPIGRKSISGQCPNSVSEEPSARAERDSDVFSGAAERKSSSGGGGSAVKNGIHQIAEEAEVDGVKGDVASNARQDNGDKNGGHHGDETDQVVLRPKPRNEAQVPFKVKNGGSAHNDNGSQHPFQMRQSRPQSAAPQTQNNRLSRFGRITKFRHLKGTPWNKSKHIENLRNISKALPAEADFIQANEERLAVPLGGPGGKLAILETSKSGRIADGVPPAVINTGAVMDFAWDPFNNRRLAVVTDEGAINIWMIPENGLHFQVNQPDMSISAHADKASIVRFHPTAQDLVATASFDWTLKIWNLATQEERIVLTGHTDQIYSMAWSQCGRFLATVCRDGRIRIYEPRAGSEPVREGGEIVARKGARIVWAVDGKFLVISGFSNRSERQIMVHDTRDLRCLHTETLDVSPAVLLPFYDEDSSTLFLTGKGEVTVYAYEIADESPYMFPLSSYKTSSPTQGLAFLHHKNVMDVRKVEFARAYRLTPNTIEPTSFTVPRVKSTYFQDDIFPPTRVLWEPTLTAEAWLNGEKEEQMWVSLQPPDMQSLSGQAPTVPTVNSLNSHNGQDSNKQNNLINNLSKEEARTKGRDIGKAIGELIETSDKLEQDNMEGVDANEWDEE